MSRSHEHAGVLGAQKSALEREIGQVRLARPRISLLRCSARHTASVPIYRCRSPTPGTPNQHTTWVFCVSCCADL